MPDAAGFEVGHGRANDSLPIDAMVAEESIVLGGEKRLNETLGQFLVTHWDAALLADRLHQLAVARINSQRHLQLHFAQAVHVRQSGPQVDISADVGECKQGNRSN